MKENMNLEGQIEAKKTYELIESLKERPVMLLTEKSEYTQEELETVRQEKELEVLYACDFLVKDIEEHEKDGYFQWGDIINLDHHSDAESLIGKKISSANMVIEYLQKNPGIIIPKGSVFTHHTDCDSVLSTLLLSGNLPPEERFGEAAIAADHTGKPNVIADLMQAMKYGVGGKETGNSTTEQNEIKYQFLVRNLQHFLNDEPIEPEAQFLLDRHLAQREELQEIKNDHKYESFGDNGEVVYIETDPNAKFDATMLVDIYPEAQVIFTYYKKVTTEEETKEEKEGYVVNVRAGQNVSLGFDLRKIMEAAGEPFGGRWGGGANKRKTKGEGTATLPKELAEKIYSAIEELK